MMVNNYIGNYILCKSNFDCFKKPFDMADFNTVSIQYQISMARRESINSYWIALTQLATQRDLPDILHCSRDVEDKEQ